MEPWLYDTGGGGRFGNASPRVDAWCEMGSETESKRRATDTKFPLPPSIQFDMMSACSRSHRLGEDAPHSVVVLSSKPLDAERADPHQPERPYRDPRIAVKRECP
jgi:hypothetical protein